MELWQVFVYELIGTMMLLIIGLGVNATATLKGTHARPKDASSNANTSNWLFVSLGWGVAIMMGVYFAILTGAAINPAVGLGYVITDTWGGDQFGVALAGELAGALLGAMLISFLFWGRITKHESKDEIAGIYVTGNSFETNNLMNWTRNFTVELVGTFTLVFAVLLPQVVAAAGAAFTPIFVGLVVFGIAMSIGSITGFSLNPARDLMPRLTHMFLPLKEKSSSNWMYSIVGTIAPLCGGAIAAGIILAL